LLKSVKVKLNIIVTTGYSFLKSLPVYIKFETLICLFETIQAGDISEIEIKEQPVLVKKG
jgi:hypothetical protein